MASKSPVLPILIVGGLAVGGVLAYKALSNSDDTSGFISGVSGQYIDEPSQRVVLTDLRQAGMNERVIERWNQAPNVIDAIGGAGAGIIKTAGESIFNPYLDYKKTNNEDRRDTKVIIKDLKIEGRNDRAETRQETRLTRQDNRIEARSDRKSTRIEARSDRKSTRIEARSNRKGLFNRR